VASRRHREVEKHSTDRAHVAGRRTSCGPAAENLAGGNSAEQLYEACQLTEVHRRSSMAQRQQPGRGREEQSQTVAAQLLELRSAAAMETLNCRSRGHPNRRLPGGAHPSGRSFFLSWSRHIDWFEGQSFIVMGHAGKPARLTIGLRKDNQSSFPLGHAAQAGLEDNQTAKDEQVRRSYGSKR
jgi:hypothetical protein